MIKYLLSTLAGSKRFVRYKTGEWKYLTEISKSKMFRFGKYE